MCKYKHILFIIIISFIYFIPLQYTLAVDKSGVKPSSISLPSGPGSIEGLGESFEPQLNTGTAPYSVKITVPPGRADHQPELSLNYNSGQGNGPFGLGWSLSIPLINRQTEKGIPSYASSDTFVYYSGEELVPLTDGTFRSENEGLFIKFAHCGLGWEARHKNGTIYRLGMYPSIQNPNRYSRIGKDIQKFNQTYKWHIDEIEDVNGNLIELFYTQLPASDNQLYIREIRYNHNDKGEYNAVVFDYEKRLKDCVSDYRAGFKIRTAYRCKEISIYIQKTETSKTLVRRYVLEYDYHIGDSLEYISPYDISLNFSLLRKVIRYNNKVNKEEASYLPPIRFGYSRWVKQDEVVTVEHSIDQSLNSNPDIQITDINGDSLPDMIYASSVGGYQYYLNEGKDPIRGGHTFANEQPMEFPSPFELGKNNTLLLDVNADGLTDLLCWTGLGEQRFYYYKNLSSLHKPDGISPMGISKEAFYYANNPLFYALTDVHMRTLDLNGDKYMDIMRTSFSGYQYYIYNPKTNKWQEKVYSFEEEPLQYLKNTPITFDYNGKTIDPSVHLTDMNGDRLLDLVKLTKDYQYLDIAYWPNMGNGYWGERIGLKNYSDHLEIGYVEFNSIKLMDVNQDGLSDMVVVHNGSLDYWIDLGEDSDGYLQWSKKYSISGMPECLGYTAVREADVNGNGSIDLLWQSYNSIQYYDFVGDSKPNQLCTIDNGIGKRIEIEYRSSTAYYLDAKKFRNPWQTKLPFPVQVVSKVTVKSGLDLDGIEGEDSQVTEYIYRDGYYDSFEKEFRGFGFVKQVDYGDDLIYGDEQATYPTTLTRIKFYTGAPDYEDNDGDGAYDEFNEEAGREDETLKGKIHWKEVLRTKDGDIDPIYNVGEDGKLISDQSMVYSTQINTWKIKTVHYAGTDLAHRNELDKTLNGQDVVFAYIEQSETQYIEKGKGTPKTVTEKHDYDLFGNKTVNHKIGCYGDDELITYNYYITDKDKWIADRLYESRKTDKYSNLVSHKVIYYDGLWDGYSYSGPGKGQLGNRGLVTKEEVYVDEEKGWIVKEYKTYDRYGNVIYLYDAKNNKHEVQYDSVSNTYPVKEIFYLEEGKTLIIEAAYDNGFGTVADHWDTNKNRTQYIYDSFGRLRKIIKPGDSIDYPTLQYEYTPADPHRKYIYEYDPNGNLTLIDNPQGQIFFVNKVTTRAREKSGQTGTFDSWQYMDGLGRNLATIEEGETQSQYVVKEALTYNVRGEKRESFLPYYKATSSYTPPLGSNYHISYYYDELGREIKRANPTEEEGSDIVTETRTEYLPLAKHVYDENDTQNGNKHFNTFTTYIIDGLERLREVHERNEKDKPYITRYDWDLLENLTVVTDSYGNKKKYYYDYLGRKVRSEDPDSGTKIFDYDNVGNLKSIEDNKGQIVNYTYDGINRLKTEDHNNDEVPEVSYYYDQAHADHPEVENVKGYLSYVIDQSGMEFSSYDGQGNNKKIIKRISELPVGANEFTTEYYYDAMDRVYQMEYPDGEEITFDYNNRSLICSIPTIIDSVKYKASGVTDTLTYANDITCTYEYDPRNRQKTLESRNRYQQILQDMKYSYDGVNNILCIEDRRAQIEATSSENRNQTFIYDDLYRLKKALGSGYGQIDFSYDAIGNMTSKGSPDIDDSLINLGSMEIGGKVDGQYNRKATENPPGPHAVTSTESGLIYSYDKNGNIKSKKDTNTDSESIYEYDAKDRLIKVTVNDSISEYIYDYMGERVVKKVTKGDVIDKTIYVSKDYEIRNGEVYKYVAFHNRRVAMIKGDKDIDEVATQTINLRSGWNLVSLYVEPANPSICAMLSEAKDITMYIYAYDTKEERYIGYTNVNRELTELHAKQGYFIWANRQCTINVTGRITQWGVDLSTGWNLTGLPIRQEEDAATYLAQFVENYRSIWSFDSTKWSHYSSMDTELELLKDLTTLKKDLAYWIDATKDSYIKGVTLDSYKIFYLSDHLSSTTIATDIEGRVIETIEYYPYGRIRYHDNREDVSYYKFTGKELDEETGLFYFGARYYDPVVGRFISVDPLYADDQSRDMDKPQNLNLYAYPRNNPILYVDPEGKAGYVFYHRDFESQATAQIEDWAATRNNETLLPFRVESIEQLKEAIQTIKDIPEEVNSLVFMYHGKPGFIQLTKGRQLTEGMYSFGEYLSANNESLTPKGSLAFPISELPNINFGKNAYIGVHTCRGSISKDEGISVGEAFNLRYNVTTYAFPYSTDLVFFL